MAGSGALKIPLCICTQIDWSEYGVDWDEVTSMDYDNTVFVADIEGVLSEEQARIFSVSNSIDTRNLSRQSLVNHYVAAKAFVYTHHSQ